MKKIGIMTALMLALTLLTTAPAADATHTACPFTYTTVNAALNTFYVVTYTGGQCEGGELWLESNGIVDWQHSGSWGGDDTQLF